MPLEPAVDPAAAVQAYLDTLTTASPSTRRQRSWALHDLLTHAPTLTSPASPPDPASPHSSTTATALAQLLSPDAVLAWIDAAASTDPPASLPGLRARAAAARALAAHAEAAGAVPTGTTDALRAALHLPTPPLAPGPDPDPVRRLLVAATPDAHPRGIHPAVWTRYCAHLHLLALTGEREDVMATLTTEALPDAGASTHLDITTGSSPTRWRLPAPARTALTGWLTTRSALIAPLTGTPPSALWVRARPSTDRVTGAHRPAGLPLSDRGLRLAFTATTTALAAGDPTLRGIGTAAVRNHARGRQR